MRTCCYCKQNIEEGAAVRVVEPDVFGPERGEAHEACRAKLIADQYEAAVKVEDRYVRERQRRARARY